MTQPAPSPERLAPSLEAALEALEAQLQSLARALLERDSAAIADGAARLQRSLQQAMPVLVAAQGGGSLPQGLQQRLVRLQGAVAAQREGLARAGAAVQRAMNVLMPAAPPLVYAAPEASRGGNQAFGRRGAPKRA